MGLDITCEGCGTKTSAHWHLVQGWTVCDGCRAAVASDLFAKYEARQAAERALVRTEMAAMLMEIVGRLQAQARSYVHVSDLIETAKTTARTATAPGSEGRR